MNERPAFARILGPIDAAVLARIDRGVYALGVAWREADADAAETLRGSWQALRQSPPRVAPVSGFVEPAVCSGKVAVLPGPLAMFPHACEKDLRIGGVELNLDRAGIRIYVEHFLPLLPAVGGAEHAALFIRPVRMSEARNEYEVGVGWMHDDSPDLLYAREAGLRPCFAAVCGFENTIADTEIGAMQALASADINH